MWSLFVVVPSVLLVLLVSLIVLSFLFSFVGGGGAGRVITRLGLHSGVAGGIHVVMLRWRVFDAARLCIRARPE